MDDYSKHPKSLTEAKGDRTGKGSDWTARDVLIAALRDLDSGELPAAQTVVVIVGGVTGNGSVHTSYYQNSPNRYVLRGLVEDFKARIDGQ